ISLLTQPQNPFYAILLGCLFTALVQSSSVTTGLAVIFTQQGILGLENAIPLIIGANIGTTATAIIAMFNMDIAAKKTALSHFLFNVGGVVIFMPFFFLYGDRLDQIQLDPAITLAIVHLLFNIATSILFIIFISPFIRLIDVVLGEGTMDFERLSIPVHSKEDDFPIVKKKLESELKHLLGFLQENYNAVALSVETNYQSVFETAGKRIEYLSFIKSEYLKYFSKAVTTIDNEEQSSELMRIINQFDYLFQIHDSINDLYNSKKILMEHYIELKSDILVLVRGITSNTLDLFDEVHKSISTHEKIDLYTASSKVQLQLNTAHKDLLALLADPTRRDAGTLTNFTTYSQRLKDKLLNFYQLCQFKKDSVATEAAHTTRQV
ncbi:MAG: Na/Pi symporter, partial [Pseudomonadales bacterium]|nr:Na/Pi symporter [Pseudomonadales bacterium]